jgi:hypothetical protein
MIGRFVFPCVQDIIYKIENKRGVYGVFIAGTEKINEEVKEDLDLAKHTTYSKISIISGW